MVGYIIRRLLLLPVILFGVTVLIFTMLELLGPYRRVALYVTDPSQLKRPEQIQQLIKKYGLLDPLPQKYARWVSEVARGNWGWSETAKRPVTTALRERFPATAELAIFSLLPVLAVGIWLGITSSVHHNRPIDHLTRVMSITGWSFPTFIFGLLALMLFYSQLQWFPPERMSDWAKDVLYATDFRRYTGLNTIDALLNFRLDVFADAVRHMVLPVLTLSYLNWALLVRVTRSSMLETLRQDYITTARSKGLHESVVIYKHATRNALIPVATISGFLVIGLLNGVVITETIFKYNGIGRWAADAAFRMDVPAVLGITLVSTGLIVFGNLIVDLIYAAIDPRVRYD